MNLKAGQFYRCAKSGAVVLVIKDGEATLSTEAGPMELKHLDVVDDNLELVAGGVETDIASRDTPGRYF